MNYNHLYHAGNLGDVFKHCVLTALIPAFFHKETPLRFIDVYAGSGLYDLWSEEAKKTKDYKAGIARVYGAPNPPLVVERFLSIVKSYNHEASGKLRYYPGSPVIARALLRPSDRMLLVDLAPAVITALEKFYRKDKQVTIHQSDAWKALNAFLPPKENRGIVLIDPPFEESGEFNTILNGLKFALKRWPTGVYAVWYPIIERRTVTTFLTAIQNTIERPTLVAELTIYPDDVPIGLNGCGIVIINPPWKFTQQLDEFLPWLWQQLSEEKQGGYKVEWLRE